jgi:hypothetical protein
VGLIDSAVTGDGVNTALGIFTPGGIAIAFDIGTDAELLASTTFPATSSLLVELEFVVDGGLSGSASLAQGEVRLGEGGAVPEPSSLFLISPAAFGLMWLNRRKGFGKQMDQGVEG